MGLVRRARALAAGAIAAALLCSVDLARAQEDAERDDDAEDEEEDAEEDDRSTVGGFDLTLAPHTFTASLGGESFRANPRPLGLGRRVPFEHRGADLGLDAPRFWGGELRLAYVRRHLRIGGHVFTAAAPAGADTAAGRPDVASNVRPEKLNVWGGGADLYFVIPFENLTISVGGVVGARRFSLPLLEYEADTCRGRRGSTRPCEEWAHTSALLYVQPRAQLDVALDKTGATFLGGYAGFDVTGSGASFGLVLGVRTPHATLAW